MRINAKEYSNIVVIYLNEDITVDRIAALEEVTKPYLNKQTKNILFDFSGSEYICSAGLGLIAHAYKIVSGNEGKVYATNLGQQIAKVFRTTSLDKFIIIRSDTEEIIKNAAEKPA